MSSRSNSLELCFSEAGSPLSSGPTTPGLEAIDPRIIEPFEFNKEDARQSCDQAAVQLNSLNLPPEEGEITKMSVSGIEQPQLPTPSFASQPPGHCAVNEANEERKVLQDCLTSMSACDQTVSAEHQCESHLKTQERKKAAMKIYLVLIKPLSAALTDPSLEPRQEPNRLSSIQII